MTNPWLQWWTDSADLLHQATFPRLLLASCLGALIGVERQWRQRAAGLRTNTLVCFGAAAFVDLGSTIAPNTTQVIAYVVSGVGFLGAGAIMKDGGSVRGLNTAATLWCSAAVGACAGAGEMLDAVFVTALLIAINSLLRPLARYIDQRSLATFHARTLYRLRMTSARSDQVEAEFQLTRAIAARSLMLREIRTEPLEDAEHSIIQAVVESTTRDAAMMNVLTEELRAFPWAESVDWFATEAEGE
ncbi:MAG TPA: MgtC/SapB family protein [Alloacidobacterium sp.]|nr:MgtC/SapB family protein [Alloacidobacterium sp.]